MSKPVNPLDDVVMRLQRKYPQRKYPRPHKDAAGDLTRIVDDVMDHREIVRRIVLQAVRSALNQEPDKNRKSERRRTRGRAPRAATSKSRRQPE